jgi:predicted amidohydrolase
MFWMAASTRAAQPPRLLRLGATSAQPQGWVDTRTNAAHYLRQWRRAGEAGVSLLCLPELIHAHGMPDPFDPQAVYAASVPIPSGWMEPFQQVARTYRMGLCLSVFEPAGAHQKVVYNTAVLIGRDGALIGSYRKVHLALREARSGVTAGDTFPVHDFEGMRAGMAICMDSTTPESARILAHQGAENLLMPIDGDFRATPWEARGAPVR